jgi:hypothetical protein
MAMYGSARSGNSGVPTHGDQWGWDCGFFPGGPKSKGGDGLTYEACQEALQQAWDEMLRTLPESAFEEWREHRDRTAWKYRRTTSGCRCRRKTLPADPVASAAQRSRSLRWTTTYRANTREWVHR